MPEDVRRPSDPAQCCLVLHIDQDSKSAMTRMLGLAMIGQIGPMAQGKSSPTKCEQNNLKRAVTCCNRTSVGWDCSATQPTGKGWPYTVQVTRRTACASLGTWSTSWFLHCKSKTASGVQQSALEKKSRVYNIK